MQLSAQQKVQAENRLKNLSIAVQIQEQTKSKINKNSKLISELIASLQDNPKGQKQILMDFANNLLGKQIIALESRSRWLLEVEQKIKDESERMVKKTLTAAQQKENFQTGIQQIQDTIKKIRQTVKQTTVQQEKKRKKIQQDLEKSLDEIRQKIQTFNKQTAEMEEKNGPLKQKIAQIKAKMEGLQGNFNQKAEEKDAEIKEQKQRLLSQIKQLQDQISKATELNKQYSTIQKQNLDKKLSIHLRTEKFPEYSTSFENSASTIGQCKQQLFKGVHRLNEARKALEESEQSSKTLSEEYLQEMKKQGQKQKKIESIKQQKEAVKARILSLQQQIKAKMAVAN